MSFWSIVHDMREEIGNISRKGFEVKYGLRSRSHRVVHDELRPMPIEALRQSCWVNLPPELLRDVLLRIEESEVAWPERRDVVACAGVCRSWREIMKEIVKTPEISQKLTFPISLKQPGPRDAPLQCFIKRNRTTQTYYLYLGLTQALRDNGKFLLAACECQRATCTDYPISIDADDMSKGSDGYIGKLRSNFLGIKFTVYDSHPPHTCSRTSPPLLSAPVDRISHEQVLFIKQPALSPAKLFTNPNFLTSRSLPSSPCPSKQPPYTPTVRFHLCRLN